MSNNPLMAILRKEAEAKLSSPLEKCILAAGFDGPDDEAGKHIELAEQAAAELAALRKGIGNRDEVLQAVRVQLAAWFRKLDNGESLDDIGWQITDLDTQIAALLERK